jgi:TolB-like protein
MNNDKRPLWQAICTAMLLIVAIPCSGQDIKAISSSLAKSIAGSGRKTVAVIDFTDLQGNVTELGRFLAEEVSVDLVGEAKGYEVIERNQLKIILQEHRLSATGLIDPQTAKKLGQFAGVDALVTGTITAFGDSVRVSAKVLDTQTARMLGATTSDIPKTKTIEELLSRGVGAQPPSSTDIGGSGASNPPAEGVGASKAVSSISAEGGNLLFDLRACSRSRQVTSCRGSVTNKSDKRVRVEFPYGARDGFLEDDLGTVYPFKEFAFGVSGDGQELEPELTIPFRFLVENVNSAAKHANITLTYNSIDVVKNAYVSNGLKAGFRNIAIQQQK